MIQKIKQWWIAVLGVSLSILDLGFDVINPILSQIDLPMWVFSIIKVVFAIYGIYRLLKQKTPEVLKAYSSEEPIVGTHPTDR